MPQMLADMDKYTENWVVIVNKNEYHLTKAQAEVLKSEIHSGNRGMIFFGDFAINIPFVEEFYLAEKIMNPKFQIEEPITKDAYPQLTNEQRAKNQERLSKMRRDLAVKLSMKKETVKKILSP